MAAWPTNPNWQDPKQINGGLQYLAADGITNEDMNKIVSNLIYIEKLNIEDMFTNVDVTINSSIGEPETRRLQVEDGALQIEFSSYFKFLPGTGDIISIDASMLLSRHVSHGIVWSEAVEGLVLNMPYIASILAGDGLTYTEETDNIDIDIDYVAKQLVPDGHAGGLMWNGASLYLYDPDVASIVSAVLVFEPSNYTDLWGTIASMIAGDGLEFDTSTGRINSQSGGQSIETIASTFASNAPGYFTSWGDTLYLNITKETGICGKGLVEDGSQLSINASALFNDGLLDGGVFKQDGSMITMDASSLYFGISAFGKGLGWLNNNNIGINASTLLADVFDNAQFTTQDYDILQINYGYAASMLAGAGLVEQSSMLSISASSLDSAEIFDAASFAYNGDKITMTASNLLNKMDSYFIEVNSMISLDTSKLTTVSAEQKENGAYTLTITTGVV